MTQADENTYEVIGEFTEDTQYLFLPFYKVYRRAFKKFVGTEVRVTITPLVYKRSDAQNRYLWGYIVPAVKDWLYETQGEKYSPDYVYTWLRIELLGEVPKIATIMGTEIVTMVGKRFSQMSVQEFTVAVDTIKAKMSERGLILKDPRKNNMLHELLDE